MPRKIKGQRNRKGQGEMTPAGVNGWARGGRMLRKPHHGNNGAGPEKKELPALSIKRVQVYIEGDSELVCHRFSKESQKKMLDKQMKEASTGREKRDPESDFKLSLYPHPDGGYGFPGAAFKCAAVTACTSLDKAITKVATRQAFFVIDRMVKIEGSQPYMRQDTVRNKGGATDLRFRGAFPEWRTSFKVRYNEKVVSEEMLLLIINTAGFAVGVGELRPEQECGEACGQFHVTKVARLD